MIAAVVPTRFRPPTLDALLSVLAADGVKAIVMDSDSHSHRIHRMWNAGVEQARDAGATEIAVLNDDIEILPGTLPMLARALRADPRVAVVYPDTRADWRLPAAIALEPTSGFWVDGSMAGFCFMLRAELPLPRFDEEYYWHCGDHAFEEQVRLAGYQVARVRGLPVRHDAPGSSAAKVREDLRPLIACDVKRWGERHSQQGERKRDMPVCIFPSGRDLAGQYHPNTAGPSILESAAVLQAIMDRIPASGGQGVFVEIGTWGGATAAVLADRRPDTLIVSVDPFWSDRHLMLYRVNSTGRPNMRLWCGDSASFFRIAGDHTVDGVFVDGDHSAAGVLLDLRAAARIVVQGGPILVHDATRLELPGIAEALGVFCRESNWVVVDRVESLAVLQDGGGR